MSGLPDELWTAWLTRRDERAFDALVRPELAHALAYARRLGCGAADAEDALQEALVRLAASRNVSPPAFGLRAWLCREVHTRARSNLRSQRRRRAREAAVAVLEPQRPGEPPIAIRDELNRAFADLDDDERTAVELRHLHDLDYAEMAFVLGASEGACRQRVSRALAKLRRRLGEGAAAIVATRPLRGPADPAALVRRAVGKAGAATATAGTIGGVLVMTATKKALLAAFALLLIFATGAAIVSGLRAGRVEPGETARLLASLDPHVPRPRAREAPDIPGPAATVAGPGFAFPKSAFVGVRVVDAAGRPVPAATVRLLSRTMRSTPIVVASRTTGEDGSVRFDRIASHAGGQFEADARTGTGFAAISATDVGAWTTLALEPAGTVRLVVTRDGRPASARVWVERWDDQEFFGLLEEREVGPSGTDAVTLPKSGRFRFVAVRPDGVSEAAELRGGSGAREVALSIPVGTHPVRVETTGGMPVADAEVWFACVPISVRPTGADGRSEIGAMPTTRLMELSLRRGGIGIRSPLSTFRSADGTWVLRIDDQTAGGRLSLVRVVDSQGVPVEGASVGWASFIGVAALGQTFTDRDGETFGIAWSGKVLVGARGFRVTFATVQPGRTEIRLEPATWRKVRVVDEMGVPVPNAWMSFARMIDGERAAVWVSSDEDGVAELVDGPGWLAAVRAPGGGMPTDAGEIPGGDVDVVWRPKPLTPIGGTLVLPLGYDSERFVVATLSGPGASPVEVGRRFSLPGTWGTLVMLRVESADGLLAGEYSGAPSADLTIPMRPRNRLRLSPQFDGQRPAGLVPRILVARDGGEMRDVRRFADEGTVWSIDLDGPGAWDVLVLVGEASGAVHAQVEQGAAGPPLPLRLSPAGTMSLRLGNASATSGISARLALTLPGSPADASPVLVRRRNLIVDETGAIRVEGLVPGRYDVIVTWGLSALGHSIAMAAGVEVRSGAATEVRPETFALRRVDLLADASGARRAGLRVAALGDRAWTRRLWPSQVLEDDGREFVLAWDGEFALEDASGAPRWRLSVVPGATSVQPASW